MKTKKKPAKKKAAKMTAAVKRAPAKKVAVAVKPPLPAASTFYRLCLYFTPEAWKERDIFEELFGDPDTVDSRKRTMTFAIEDRREMFQMIKDVKDLESELDWDDEKIKIYRCNPSASGFAVWTAVAGQ